MSDRQQLTVVSIRPTLLPGALAGGMVGADLGLFYYIVQSNYFHAGPLVLLTLVTTGVGLAVAGLSNLIIQQRPGSIHRLNRELVSLQTMRDRGLLEQDEHQTLKSRVIEQYEPVRVQPGRIRTAGLWGGLIGSLLPLVISGAFASGGLYWQWMIALLAPAVALAGLVGGTITAVHSLGQSRRERLAAGETSEWRALGSRR